MLQMLEIAKKSKLLMRGPSCWFFKLVVKCTRFVASSFPRQPQNLQITVHYAFRGEIIVGKKARMESSLLVFFFFV